MIQLKLARPPLLISVCLVLILIGAIFFRFYNFKDTFLFLGDQGRDSLIARGIFKEHNLVFIGPVTSVGNLYLGPFYYYFMAPFLWMSYPSPLGPGLAVAVVSVITVYLMYSLGQEIVGKRAALFAALFYAFSAEIVRYSRFSWNPNLTAPVTLLLVWCLWRAWKKNVWYWLGVSLCFSILIQLHYIVLSTLGGIGIIWLIQLRQLWLQKQTKPLKQFVIASVVAIGIFLVSLTPLALFNQRHDGLIVNAFFNLFFKEKVLSRDEPANLIQRLTQDFQLLVIRSETVLFGYTLVANLQLGIALLITFFLSLAVLLKKKLSEGPLLLLAMLLPCLVSFALYKGELYVHYFVFVLPILFLLWGFVLASVTRKMWGCPVAAILVIVFLVFNISRMPLKGYGVTIDNLNSFSQNILTHLRPDEQFTLLLLSGTKDIYGSNYRYFFTALDHPPVDPALEAQTDTLVVINEDAVPDVPHQDIYELNIFPSKVPSEVYTIPQGPQVLIFRK